MLRDNLLTGFKLWGVRRVQSRTALIIAGSIVAFGLLGLWSWRVGAIMAGGLLVAVVYYTQLRADPGSNRRWMDLRWGTVRLSIR